MDPRNFNMKGHLSMQASDSQVCCLDRYLWMRLADLGSLGEQSEVLSRTLALSGFPVGSV